MSEDAQATQRDCFDMHRTGKVNLLSGGPKGGYAHFVKGKLEIPYFNNWFGTSRPSFSIALWICLDKVNLKNDQVGQIVSVSLSQRP